MNQRASEVVCAERMRSIAAGRIPVDGDDYYVEDVAERYCVTCDTVYRGIRRRSPLYPKAYRRGKGPKAVLVITPAAVKACDGRRIKFYKSTPSWLKLDGKEGQKPPVRRSARELLGAVR